MAKTENMDELPILNPQAPNLHASTGVPGSMAMQLGALLPSALADVAREHSAEGADREEQSGALLPRAMADVAREHNAESADIEERRAEHAAPADELLSSAAEGCDAAGSSPRPNLGTPEDEHAQSSVANVEQPEPLELELPAAAKGGDHLSSSACAALDPGEEHAPSSSSNGEQTESAEAEPPAPLSQHLTDPTMPLPLKEGSADHEAGVLAEAMPRSMGIPENAEAATAAVMDDGDDGFVGSDDGFGDFEEAGSFAGADDVPASGVKGPTPPELPAAPSEGFMAFEEVTVQAAAAAEEPGRALSQGQQQQDPPKRGVAFTELFLASKADYLRMVREMLAPHAQHLLIVSSGEVDTLKERITLDPVLQQLAASPCQPGSSTAIAQLARQALDLGSKQVGSFRCLTPVAWEGTPAQARFLAGLQMSEPLPNMKREQPARSAEAPVPNEPPKPQDGQQHAHGADIFASSGAVLDGDYISRDTGTLRKSPSRGAAAPSSNGGAHAAGEGLGSADERFPSGGHAPNGGEAAAPFPDLAAWEPDSAAWSQGSAAKAHLGRRSSPKGSPCADRRGSGGSPSRLSRSSFSFEANGGPPRVPGDVALPDLSFMLADTLVLPAERTADSAVK